LPKINRTKYAIIGMLSIAPMSGYDMKKRFDDSIAYFWNENYGHIYPNLKRLEDDGSVTRKTVPTEGKPSRHIYSITEKGRKQLLNWLMLPADRPNLRIELLLKLFLGHMVPPANLIQKVEEEKKFCELALETFDRIEQHLNSMKSANVHREAQFGLITLHYGQRYYQAVHRWCMETLDSLMQLNNNKN
jgi:DNA-binding PadR family transcriptional regulator